MTTEKKLIAFSILAIIIGVCSVLPLGILMTTPAKAEISSEPWFSMNVPYAYWVTSNGPLDNDFGFSFPEDSSLNETNSVSEQHMMIFNLTLNVDTANEPIDGRVEYYQIDLSSDKELVETTYFFIGTNSNSSFAFNALLDNIHFMRSDWYDTAKFGGGGGLLKYNWTAGFSQLWPEGGSGSGTLGGSGTSMRVSIIREAEELFVTVYRLGWATFTDNSTIFTSANNEILEQIQLEKFGDGWLYNTLVPEDELSTINLLQPLSFEELYQVQPNNGQ